MKGAFDFYITNYFKSAQFFAKLIFSILLCTTTIGVYAQEKKEKIKLEHADSLVFDDVVSIARRLKGNVVFSQGEVKLYCDSAYFYDATNVVDAYENVRIVKNNDLNLTGKFLHYDGDSKLATITNNVRMTDNKMVLTTEALDYNMNTETGFYNNGATIVDKDNTLTSQFGYYFSNTKMLSFKKNVVLVNPRYRLTGDTLMYNTATHTATFVGPTYIKSSGRDATFIYCESGWYNTDTDKSFFRKNSFIQSKEQKLFGDSLRYDKKAGTGEAFGNVMISDSLQKTIIAGDYGKYNEISGQTFVTGRSQMIQIFDSDSLFMHADTLFAKSDTSGKQKTYYAYHHVKFFKKDFQGKCDSLTYSTTDTLMRMFALPVLWSDSNQITGDSIHLQMENNKIARMYMYESAFIASYEDTNRYNQIRGKNMIGYFENNELHKINVEGNGQTIYYGRNNAKQLVGVNRADCSDLVIHLDSSKVSKIILLNKPEATFYPIDELNTSELLLRGFKWRNKERPMKKEDIFSIE
ncbi:MAG TPA: OstA-like protein [Bacteroidia bacterium]|nr:OstA-like protein [Bacteroidia bacterium]